MDDKLYFFSKSCDKIPGKGINEIINDINSYNELLLFKDWRKILSNFHIYPFKYEQYTYNTIEHVFQAKKIQIVDNNKAFYFTLESGHEIGLGNGEIARKNRKICKLNKEQLKLWNNLKDDIMYNVTLKKYKVCKEARDILKATNNAQLWHIVSRSQPIRFYHLEKIRDLI